MLLKNYFNSYAKYKLQVTSRLQTWQVKCFTCYTVKSFKCVSMKTLINLCWYVSRTWNKIVKLLEIMLSKIENIRLTFYECAISDWNLWENVKGLRIHFYLLPWSYPTSNTHFSCFCVLKVFLLDIIVPKHILQHNRYLQRKAFQLYRKNAHKQ